MMKCPLELILILHHKLGLTRYKNYNTQHHVEISTKYPQIKDSLLQTLILKTKILQSWKEKKKAANILQLQASNLQNQRILRF